MASESDNFEDYILSPEKLRDFLHGMPGYRDNEILDKALSEVVEAARPRHPFLSDYYFENAEKISNLYTEIGKLKTDFSSQVNKYVSEKRKSEKKEKELEQLKRNLDELLRKLELANILPRVRTEAAEYLIRGDGIFKDNFQNLSELKSTVISIDIRRSTSLMLNARTASSYATFITKLSQELSSTIKSNFGIVDKFTGDGILAFFPDFFSGIDSVRLALKAAEACHQIFNDHYYAHRRDFNVVLKNVGLGIGVDYGMVTLINNGSELTVVGIPVVYACRLSSASPNTTLLNQPALEKLTIETLSSIMIKEVVIDLKHEGEIAAYEIKLSNEEHNSVRSPEWYSLLEK
ncbi:adenylate/guanylate cyclase domain-containing protein [Dyadobacter sp. CY323]|uniref:adenylate/guanylate cyclase domain-containing protein n=1 Tax=Dyadobacter sp. CY323 TaxID=2907302 RepID=UPI001F43891A|nr:adenylate/guanylate cyclase domain-containing protein [Dyadobacter sp. CY323]MCE6989008.1 adenylate/guanylate cyclase domain-containing protein [Dyadobacter sp. CY323]